MKRSRVWFGGRGRKSGKTPLFNVENSFSFFLESIFFLHLGRSFGGAFSIFPFTPCCLLSNTLSLSIQMSRMRTMMEGEPLTVLHVFCIKSKMYPTAFFHIIDHELPNDDWAK